MPTDVADKLSPETVKAIDEIVADHKILSLKNKVMDRMKNYSFFNSISETCKFVASPLMFAGISFITTGIMPGAAAATANWVIPAGIGILSAALGLLGVGITAGYAASRVAQGGGFDNLEINAMSTARHLVDELEQKNLCVADKDQYPQNCRNDGKTWVKVVNRPGYPQAEVQPQNLQS